MKKVIMRGTIAAAKNFLLLLIMAASVMADNGYSGTGGGQPHGGKGSGDRRLFTSEGETVGTVYYVPQFTEFKEVSANDLLFLRKVLERARRKGVRAVIFELDTPGGRIDVALRYLSVFAKSEVPVIAHLNPQGISAGMIIALAADRIAMDRAGIIGDAMPIEATPWMQRPITAPPAKSSPETDGGQDTARTGKKPERQSGHDGNPLEPLLRELDRARGADRQLTSEDKRLTDQKFLTVFFKILQVLAEKNSRPVNVIRATADPYIALTDGKDGIDHQAGSPLTLSAKEAHQLGVVDYLVSSRKEILKEIGLRNARIEEIRPDATEQIFYFLAHPAVAGVLIMLGLVGLFIEIKTPGFGVPGILGICMIVLYFIGQIAVGASEWGPMVLFFIGTVLVAVEIFLIPGFGLVGILGGGCILGSMVAAFGFDNFETAVAVVGCGLAAALLVIAVLAIYVLPKTALFHRFALTEDIGRDNGLEADQVETLTGHGIGSRGVTVSPLRPAGIVILDGNRFDATTEGGFIDAGCEVEVVGKRNFQLIVREKKTT